MFRNRDNKIKYLWEVFFREYLEQLFKGYETFYNPTEIEEHLQKVINTKKVTIYIYSKRT